MLGRRIVWCCRRAVAVIVVLASCVASQPVAGQSASIADVASSRALSLASAPDPRAAERFRSAAALANRELYDLAAKDFSQLIDDFPNDPLAKRARLERGVCLFRLEQYADARGEFRKLLANRDELDANLAEQCYAHLGLAEYNLGRESHGDRANESFKAAATAFATQLEQFPSGPHAAESAFYRGEALYALGQLNAAVVAYQSCLKNHPQPPQRGELYHALGVAQQEQGDAAGAAATFARFLTEFPQHEQATDVKLRRGEALLVLGKPAEAAACFVSVVKSSHDPDLVQRAAFLATSATFQAGDLADAAERAADFNARFPNSQFAAEVDQIAAEIHLQHGKYADAAKRFQRLLAEYPQHAHRDLWTVRQAHCLMLSDSKRDAIRLLEPMWRIIPDDTLRADAALVLGTSYYQLGQAAEAIDVLQVAAALPHWSQADVALFTLAKAEHANKQPDNALETLAEVIANEPHGDTLAPALLFRGELLATEAPTLAIADLERLLTIAPNGPLAPRALLAKARVEYAEHQLANAGSTLDRFLKSHRQHELAVDVLLLRAAVRHEIGNFAGGIEDAGAVVAANPPRPKRSDAVYTRGLCELGLNQPAAAAQSFLRIVQKDPQYRVLDRVLYDLAWAYKQSHNSAQATKTFQRLVDSYPESPLAAESTYHVGEARFAAKDLSVAAKCFFQAAEQATDAELAEKAFHKLAWCCFERHQFEAAEESFDKQIVDHPEGPLATDAILMIGECRFQRDEFADALGAFNLGLNKASANESIRELALLHGGQAAGQLGKWEQSLTLLDTYAREFPASRWSNQTRYERGWALYRLDRLDEAQQQFETVAAANADALGARARFMVGEVLFKKSEFDDAVRTFFQVAYGYGDVDAPEPIRHWQAEAMFEAARCLEETGRFDSARKLYEELLERHPTSEKAAFARSSLKEIMRR